MRTPQVLPSTAEPRPKEIIRAHLAADHCLHQAAKINLENLDLPILKAAWHRAAEELRNGADLQLRALKNPLSKKRETQRVLFDPDQLALSL